MNPGTALALLPSQVRGPRSVVSARALSDKQESHRDPGWAQNGAENMTPPSSAYAGEAASPLSRGN